MNNDTTIRRHGTNKTIKKADYLQNKSYQNNHRPAQKSRPTSFRVRTGKDREGEIISFCFVSCDFDLFPVAEETTRRRQAKKIRNPE